MTRTISGPRNFRVVNHAQTNGGEGFTITFTENGQGHRFFAATNEEAEAVCAPIMERILAGTGFAANR